jgi:tripartite-type tricarboxylate transporter receptor subunit TctC
VAGDADMTTAGADGAISFAKAGQVKILSTWRPQRNPAFPNTATPAEEGYGDLYTWGGMAAPVGVPKDIINKLSSVMMEAINDKAVQDHFKKAGSPTFTMTADQMNKRVTDDAKWIGDLMTELGMTKK